MNNTQSTKQVNILYIHMRDGECKQAKLSEEAVKGLEQAPNIQILSMWED